ncbi:hypothetical protein J2Z31_005579 [Sinorhizobium kostiense]|uniref:Transposase n=1 Tax=Sinorhizobium kostiense TaxID=76747 RepID=A0ABS4R819_9HYPH|nr:hypothetical protein [Sinorhizobium kostiense]
MLKRCDGFTAFQAVLQRPVDALDPTLRLTRVCAKNLDV